MSKIFDMSNLVCRSTTDLIGRPDKSLWPTNDLTLKAVAHWTLKGLTIFYQNSTKSVEISVGSFFQGGEHGKCQYVPEIVSNVQIDEEKIGSNDENGTDLVPF